MTPPRTRVVLVEEDRALCQRFERVLLRADHAVLAAVCPTSEDAMRRLVDEQLRADVAVIDVRANAVESIRRLAGERPDLATMVLAHAEDDGAVFEALRAGAAGYLVATDDLVALRDRVVVLLHGGASLSPSLAKRLLETRIALTPEELAVVTRIADDGERMPADPSTIHAIYRKLGSASRSDSVREIYRRRNG